MKYHTFNLPSFKGYSAIENRNPSQGEQVSNFWVRESSLKVREGCVVQITGSTSLDTVGVLELRVGSKYLVGAMGAVLKVADASWGAWASTISTGCATAKFGMTSFRDKLYMGNGTQRLSFDGSATVDISTYSPAFNTITSWKNRVFSNKVSAPIYGFYSDASVAGEVSEWDMNYQLVAENDADPVMAATHILNFLLILCRNSAYAWYGSEPIWESPKVAALGAISRRALVNVNEVAYWLSDNGVYRYGGGAVQPVSFELADIKDIIDYDYADNACAVGWKDYFILACPSKGSTTNDQVLLYDTMTLQWSQINLPFSITQFLRDDNTLYAAATNGNLYKLFDEDAADDAGTAITATWLSDNLHLGVPGRPKKLKKIAIELADVAAGGGLNLYFKMDGGNWSSAYSIEIPTGEPGAYVIEPVQEQKFRSLQVKIVTTASAIINNMTFGFKAHQKVK